ncbi:hypothetical protein C8D96_2693 [Kushneria marisflavi]|nr:hypothetical protein C8D96_2693 [Kushneria marisflavi]
MSTLEFRVTVFVMPSPPGQDNNRDRQKRHGLCEPNALKAVSTLSGLTGAGSGNAPVETRKP